jgi:hypothetical protein
MRGLEKHGMAQFESIVRCLQDLGGLSRSILAFGLDKYNCI